MRQIHMGLVVFCRKFEWREDIRKASLHASHFTLHVLFPSGRTGGGFKKMGSVENWMRKNDYLCR